MAVHRFTDRWIQTLSPTRNDSRIDYADKLCPCLHLRVTARGTKTFSAMPRVDGRLQRRTIGQYPIISLASARAATLEMLRKVAEGNDPRQQSAARALIPDLGRRRRTGSGNISNSSSSSSVCSSQCASASESPTALNYLLYITRDMLMLCPLPHTANRSSATSSKIYSCRIAGSYPGSAVDRGAKTRSEDAAPICPTGLWPSF